MNKSFYITDFIVKKLSMTDKYVLIIHLRFHMFVVKLVSKLFIFNLRFSKREIVNNGKLFSNVLIIPIIDTGMLK